MSLGPLYVLLGEVSAQVLCPFSNWIDYLPGVELCEFFLYILEIKPLSEISLANMFSCRVDSLSILIVFFSHAEAFYFLRSHLFLLSFMSLALGDILMKILLHGISKIFLPMFYSRTFMVLWLIFKCFIHLEFIFAYGVSWRLSFIFLHVAVQISQPHFLRRLFLLHFMFLPPLSNINWP